MQTPIASRPSTPIVHPAPGAQSGSQRWVQLAIGVVCMMAISSPQYVWALLTKPMAAKLGVTLAELQVTFSILIVLQTFLAPVQGFLVERFGPKRLLSLGAILTGGSWVLAAGADTLAGLYLSYGLLGGIGTGIIYIGVIGLMVKWFPDKRGLATGLVAAGYGIGAALTTFPISISLAASGYQHTLVVYGLAFGIVGVVAAAATIAVVYPHMNSIGGDGFWLNLASRRRPDRHRR
jgi:OFA family oxalate/formate antiporter-like MFS transporter